MKVQPNTIVNADDKKQIHVYRIVNKSGEESEYIIAYNPIEALLHYKNLYPDYEDYFANLYDTCQDNIISITPQVLSQDTDTDGVLSLLQ